MSDIDNNAGAKEAKAAPGTEPPPGGSGRSGGQPADPKLRASFGVVDQSSRAFDEVRRLVEHEDGLVDKRIGWMLAFNGFLFAAYGLSLGAEISLVEMVQTEPEGAYCVAGNCAASVETLTLRIETLRSSLVIAGCLSALAALAGVWAAMRAMAYVRHDYGVYLRDSKTLGSVVPAFPSVKAAEFLGNAYGLLMPCLVSVPWLYVWSKGYAGPFPEDLLGEKSWMILLTPLGVMVVAGLCLRLPFYQVNDARARHEK